MKRFLSKHKSPAQATTDIYYASDLHGADRVWRKFLGAGRFYNVDALIMGGDLTGKAIIPVEQLGERSFRMKFLGEERRAGSPEKLEELLDAVRYNGMYPWLASPDEILRHSKDDEARADLFGQVMTDELRRWVSLADERMVQYGIDVLVMSGNDDPAECDEIIEAAGARAGL